MSNLKLKATPVDYKSAMEILKGRESVSIGHNTRLEYSNGDVYATYHGNAIVRYDSDGSVWASWAGYATPTTANRLNKLSPGRFNIKNREPQVNGVTLTGSWTEWHKVG
jgi:hypothetical protein